MLPMEGKTTKVGRNGQKGPTFSAVCVAFLLFLSGRVPSCNAQFVRAAAAVKQAVTQVSKDAVKEDPSGIPSYHHGDRVVHLAGLDHPADHADAIDSKEGPPKSVDGIDGEMNLAPCRHGVVANATLLQKIRHLDTKAQNDPGSAEEPELNEGQASADRADPTTRRLQAVYRIDATTTTQPLFEEYVPNALDPSFIYDIKKNKITVGIGETTQETGLRDPTDFSKKLKTDLYGYGVNGKYTWPGKTFEVFADKTVTVTYENNLPVGREYLITNLAGDRSVIDTSLHWAYSLPGYEDYTIKDDGVPVVPHLHGGNSDFEYDGNPEFFWGPGQKIQGPQYVTNEYVYDNVQPDGTLWVHDHALGITRLNVYAGLACFYIIRNKLDNGTPKNKLNLPAYPYEAALAIQDRMFKSNGELFYPAFPEDPFYEDFITDGGVDLPEDPFADGGPTALAEFFGDFMVVNGVIWPKMDVERRKYRLRLLNGCDSRFLIVQFHVVPGGARSKATVVPDPSAPVPFVVIGNDQGFGEPTVTDTLVVPTGSRVDLIFDFGSATIFEGDRIIMKNIGGDEPFGGDIPGRFEEGALTDRIMAFDAVLDFDDKRDDLPIDYDAFEDLGLLPEKIEDKDVDYVRRVALFEGRDEFGRLQPILGTAEPAVNSLGEPIFWPNTAAYKDAGLEGQMEGTIAWHSPTTENPKLDAVEEWEIWNVSADAHPIHLHLVHFEVISRHMIKWDSNLDPAGDGDTFVSTSDGAAGDGIYLEGQSIVQHNGALGEGFKIVHPNPDDLKEGYNSAEFDPNQDPTSPFPFYVESGRNDMVTALPSQVTKIRAKFNKEGRFVWHCHILSHEDHEMMRVLQVGKPDETGMPAPPGPSPSLRKINLDFDKLPNGNPTVSGEYVSKDWEMYGVTMSASGGYSTHPRLFDTKDKDAKSHGSPNNRCPNPGPGSGKGGEPDEEGANCEPLGNVLIIQKDNKPEGKPSKGTITFSIKSEVKIVYAIGLLNVDKDSTIEVILRDGGKTKLKVKDLGDNAVQTVPIDQENVFEVRVNLKKEGAVTFIELGLPDDATVGRN